MLKIIRVLSRFEAAQQQRFCSSIALRPRKGTAKDFSNQNFVDWVQVKFVGGNGGNGNTSFGHFWCAPDAGPNGGDGGNGGHVILKVCKTVDSLGHIPKVCEGEAGVKGMHESCFGKSAKHKIIDVPVGTLIKDIDGREIADLSVEGDTFVAARGGAGGKGNQFFLSSEVKAPKYAEAGAYGEDKEYILELKLIANIGLIGFPNAGKSTLLRAVSRARPKVAAYPFTTLNPHVGIIQFDDFVQLSVADLPGLIAGAHQNRGLGFSFLRHVERCACLLFVIDLSVEEPWEQLEVLKYEVEQYQHGLSKRFQAIVGNKIDLPESNDNLEKWRARTSFPILPISAKRGNNVTELVNQVRKIYDRHNIKLESAEVNVENKL